MDVSSILFIAFIILCIFLYFKLFKRIVVGAICIITGGVKTGKSTLSVWLATQDYKRVLFKWKVKKFFCSVLKKPIPEMPLLYSNVPLKKVKNYTPLKLEHLLRQERLKYKSIVYIQEASLVCDSQLIKDKDLNNSLMLFFKLFSHMTHGGRLYVDSQQIADTHYSLRRSMSNYIYIHHMIKIPFFVILYVREMLHSEDNSVVNVAIRDVDEDLKRIIVPKSVWKKFDCYCMSSLTDYLDVNSKVEKVKNLKVENVISFRPEFNISVSDVKRRYLIKKQQRSDYENSKK